MNNILEKIMKIWYFENTHQDKSNNILYDIIYLCILVEKYGQNKLSQNYILSNGSSIAGRREYYVTHKNVPWELRSRVNFKKSTHTSQSNGKIFINDKTSNTSKRLCV